MTSEQEGLPQAMIEAMASGLVCVVPDIGDISDSAIHGYNSLVVKPLCIKSYCEAIHNLLNDESLYNKLSKNAIKTVKDNYTLQSVTNEWQKLLERY